MHTLCTSPERKALYCNLDGNSDDEAEEGGGGVNQAADFDRMMRAELIKVCNTLQFVCSNDGSRICVFLCCWWLWK